MRDETKGWRRREQRRWDGMVKNQEVRKKTTVCRFLPGTTGNPEFTEMSYLKTSAQEDTFFTVLCCFPISR